MARIIKATELDAAEPRVAALRLKELAAEVRDAVVDARRQAARILAAAREQARSLHLNAEEKGYAQGFARGRAEGHDEGARRAYEEVRRAARGEAEELASAIRGILQQLGEARGSAAALARGQWVELAVMLAERIVGRAGEMDIQAATHNLAKALNLTEARGTIRVLVNPLQLSQLQSHCPQLADLMPRGADVQLVGDESVTAGGVKLQTKGGEIDATLETQLDNIAEALLGSRRRANLGHYEPSAAVRQIIHESA